MRKFKTRELTLLAALTAIEIVLSRFLSVNAWNIKIGFGFVPIVIAAVLFGPVEAGIVAALADFIGAILFPIGAYFPLFTLTAFLTGLCFGLFLNKKRTVWNILAAVAVNQLVLSLLINSLWISVLYGSPYLPLLKTRLIQCAVLFPTQLGMILLITKSAAGKNLIAAAIAKDKKDLRREMKNAAAAMDAEAAGRADRLIFDNLSACPEFINAHTVFCYISLPHEVATMPILETVLNEGKRLVVPKINGGTMEAKEISSLSTLFPGTFGILEPDEACPDVSASDIDLCIVPCLTCNHSGERLGRGGGYYDRFLADYTGASAMICREALVLRKISTVEHDKRLRLVVTDKGVFRPS